MAVKRKQAGEDSGEEGLQLVAEAADTELEACGRMPPHHAVPLASGERVLEYDERQEKAER